MDVKSDWYEEFFGEDWLDLVALRIADERTQAEVDFVVGALELDPGARVLDLACGHGRHSLELARRGYRVTGLDRAVARRRAQTAANETLDVEFGECDMREIPRFAPTAVAASCRTRCACTRSPSSRRCWRAPVSRSNGRTAASTAPSSG